jgi:dephospho-CoA kinase
VITIGLTGGIGSGKSTVSSMLAGRGAVVIDADEVAREVVEPGRPAWLQVRRRFGPTVVTPEGVLDRAALAGIVFSDQAARRDLEQIVHPEVARLMTERIRALSGSDHVVVLDIPLLAESGRERYLLAGVLVVDCPVDIAVERLVFQRGMDRKEAERRVAAQIPRTERIKIADFVIMNTGTLDELAEMVARAWEWIERLPTGTTHAER